MNRKLTIYICSVLAIILASVPAAPAARAQSGAVVKDTLGLDKSFCQSPAKLIQGKISGVWVRPMSSDVNEELSVTVRSLNSIRSDAQPLWVIDGMPMGTSAVSFLNPYDIESIQVLKDASATAIYGPQGANGVILVNTRRIDGADGLKVEWNSNFSLSLPYRSGAASSASFSHNHSLGIVYTKGRSALRVSGQFRNVTGVAPRNRGNSGKFAVSYETKVNPVIWFGTNTFFSVGGESSPMQTGVEYPDATIFLAERCSDGSYGTVDGWKADFDNDAKIYHLVNSNYLRINFLKEFYFNANLGMEYFDRTRYQWWGNGTPKGAGYNGYATITGTSGLRFNALPELVWDRYFGDHHIKLSGGAEINSDRDKYNDMVGWDFFSHELRAKGLNINAARTDIDTWSNSLFNVGAIASLKYSWKDRVGADLAYRADWTPKYDDATPVNYWSAGVFVKICEGVRLTGGYGVDGTQKYVPWSMFDNVLAGEYPYVDSQVGYYYEALMRTRTQEWNVGVDFDLLKGRLKGGVKYFRGHTDDSFNAFCFGRKREDSYLWDWAERQDFFSRTCGFTRSGLEVDIDALAVDTKNIKWSVGGNFTWAENTVTDVHPEDLLAKSPGDGIITSANVVGQPLASIVGYRTDENGEPADVTGDGRVTDADMVLLGNSLPRFYGGLFTTLKLWNFSVDLTFDYALGFKTADLTSLCVERDGEPMLLDSFVRSADYLRLGHLGVAYDWNYGQKAFLKGLRVSLCGDNLFTAGAFYDCLCYSSYPNALTLTAGVKLIF